MIDQRGYEVGERVLLLPRRDLVALTAAAISLLLLVAMAGTTGERFSLLPPTSTRFSAATAMRELWSRRRCLCAGKSDT